MKKLLIISSIILTSNFLSGQIINIPTDYPTIQQGINAASNGDTVLVDIGTYVENINFNGKNITVASNYLITQDTSFISQTIIDGDSLGSVVAFSSNEDSTACLCGFTITNGFASNLYGVEPYSGGGIFCINSSPKLINLLIAENITWAYNKEENISDDNFPLGSGGGIYLENSNSLLKDLVVDNNNAFSAGGGIYCFNSNINIQDCSITNNNAGGTWTHGGGLAIFESTAIVSNTIFAFNEADQNSRGGGISSEGSTTHLINVQMNNNSINYFGAGDGIWCFGGEMELHNVIIENSIDAIEFRNCNSILTNVTLSNNSRGIRLGHEAIVSIQNSILWNNDSIAVEIRTGFEGNDITIRYSDIQDGENGINMNNGGSLHWLEGNIIENPLFFGSGDHPLQLSAESPCIDAGSSDTSGMNLPQFDIVGNKRIWDGDNNGSEIIDMGAHEYGSIPVIIKEPIVNESNDQAELKIFPNPFSQSTVIELELNEKIKIALSIYKQLGEKAETIFEGEKEKGIFKLTWDSKNLPSGIYFIQLQTDNGITTQKILKN